MNQQHPITSWYLLKSLTATYNMHCSWETEIKRCTAQTLINKALSNVGNSQNTRPLSLSVHLCFNKYPDSVNYTYSHRHISVQCWRSSISKKIKPSSYIPQRHYVNKGTWRQLQSYSAVCNGSLISILTRLLNKI